MGGICLLALIISLPPLVQVLPMEVDFPMLLGCITWLLQKPLGKPGPTSSSMQVI